LTRINSIFFLTIVEIPMNITGPTILTTLVNYLDPDAARVDPTHLRQDPDPEIRQDPAPAAVPLTKVRVRRHDYSLFDKKNILIEALKAKAEPGNSIRKVNLLLVLGCSQI
jgi:hypothetical protein